MLPLQSILMLYLVDNLNKKEDMCMAFRILHDVLCEGKVACICLWLGSFG